MALKVIQLVVVEGYELRKDLYYWREGLTWAGLEPDGSARVGLTDLGQKLAKKIRFVRLRPKGANVEQGKPFGTLETTKWVGGLQSPLSGEIIDVNIELSKKPMLVNNDPYGKGWMVRIKPLNLEVESKKLFTGDAAVQMYREEIAKKVKK